ncbi:MAG: glycosyltransferase [Saprospirales bacterium]|nr:glycosyltransferase [Saprospirales bacterium]
MIDDGSYDNSWNTIESLTQTIPNLIGIKLSRNFGQHYAIACGIEHVKGEWIVVMDGDLQDNPQEITRLLEKTNEGYKIIMRTELT